MSQRRRRATTPALLSVLRSFGAPVESDRDLADAGHERMSHTWRRPLEPVTVVWDGRGGVVTARVPAKVANNGARMRVELEDGDSVDLGGPAAGRAAEVEGIDHVVLEYAVPPIPFDYHRIRFLAAGEEHEAMLISAPRRCYQGDGATRWGVFLPLYALRSERDWGVADLTDLGELLRWTRGLGGDIVATLPMLAAFLDDPFEPSPYAPASRLFWNELYLDVTRTPELERSAEARSLLESVEIRDRRDDLRGNDFVDLREALAVKRRLLEPLCRALHAEPSSRRDALEAFVDQRPDLRDYARFRGAMATLRSPWPEWPRRLRDGRLEPRDVDDDAMRYHRYVQWLCHEQLEELAGDTGLFLDLPLGVHPASYDLWRERDAFAQGVTGGAPPDTFFTAGQDWGFPPLHPERIREQEFRYPIACLRHLMRHASAVRIDHVMWMRRMFWVPDGMSPREGVYVRYPEEELYAILSLESHRNRCVIVGEDLGTVPKAVRRTMARHGVHRVYVLQYELRPSPHRPVGNVPAESQASLNTHDMPPFASIWEGLDIDDRVDLGLLDTHGARKEQTARERLRKALVLFLRDEGWLEEDGAPEGRDVMLATQRFLAASPAQTVLVNLEDLWGERRPQNVPGTDEERPNWTRKAARSFEEFREAPDVVGTLQEMDRLRREGRP